MKSIVAAAQFAPEYGDFEKGVAKAVTIVEQAAKQDVQLLVFPELWFLGYPYWASMDTRDPVFQQYMALFMAEAGPADDPRLKPVLDAAQKHGMALNIGIHERDGYSLYNTQILIDPHGQLASIHRKLMPTFTERLVHGFGDGSDISAHDFGFGAIGGLMCFEHQMTLARAALCQMGVQIHCAQWPGQGFLSPVIDASMRQLAHENGCFVVSAREVMSVDRLSGTIGYGAEADRWQGVGGASIVAPNATYLAEPVFDDERLVVAELDLSMIPMIKMHLDNAGHYARPDVFQLLWDDRPKPVLKRPEQHGEQHEGQEEMPEDDKNDT